MITSFSSFDISSKVQCPDLMSCHEGISFHMPYKEHPYNKFFGYYRSPNMINNLIRYHDIYNHNN